MRSCGIWRRVDGQTFPDVSARCNSLFFKGRNVQVIYADAFKPILPYYLRGLSRQHSCVLSLILTPLSVRCASKRLNKWSWKNHVVISLIFLLRISRKNCQSVHVYVGLYRLKSVREGKRDSSLLQCTNSTIIISHCRFRWSIFNESLPFCAYVPRQANMNLMNIVALFTQGEPQSELGWRRTNVGEARAVEKEWEAVESKRCKKSP